MIYPTVDGLTMSGAERLLAHHGLPAPYTLPRLRAAILARGWRWELRDEAEAGLWVAVTLPPPSNQDYAALGYVQVQHLSIPAALAQAFALALRDTKGQA